MADSDAVDKLGLLPRLHCPQCHSPLGATDRYCAACGVDLGLAALLAEREVLAQFPAAEGEPYLADENMPRLGEYLLQSGAITSDQLYQALRRQAEASTRGRPLTIGQALLELGIVSRELLDRALVQQIQELQSALIESNRQLERRVVERTAELQRALDRLTELNELKNNFISNISHELRTPLAQIKGYTALLADGSLGTLNTEQAEALRVAMKAAERLGRLIEDFIQYAASARGELSLNLAPTFFQQIAAKALAASQVKAAQGNVNLHSQVPGSLPAVLADTEKIQWVIFQLLDNAIKFTPAGGSVTLTAVADHRSIHVTIKDTGIGIPAERLPELFEPFHQLDGSPTRRFGGTGLGLALVKRIVEAHGARVAVDSVVNQGSVFSFSLPLAIPG